MPAHARACPALAPPLPSLTLPPMCALRSQGGSIIRELAARSGASVKVAQKDTINAAGERNVMIEGTPEQVAGLARPNPDGCGLARSARARSGSRA